MIEFTGEKYVNLHNHSYYSALDGLSSPEDMVDACIANGSRALAITDHGTCGGWYNFQKSCLAKGVKPILGNEVYISPDHTSVDPKDPRYHLVLLAKNHLGVQNLMELSTIAETKGKYKKPRIDFKLLQAHHEGLICMSACCIGELPSKLWQGDNDGAIKMANEYKDLFGDDYYIEIMMHKYNQNAQEQEKREKVLAKQLYSLAKKLNIKTVCSNDAHYANRSDAPYHDVMLSMQTHDHIKNPDRFTFNGEQFYLRPYEEMYDLYKSAPEMLLHTVEIAEKIESDAILLPSKDLLPIFNVPQGVTSETAYLKELVKEGMKLHGFINDPIYRERIKMEMELIVRCGFVRYFLTLWDIINYAKQQSVRTGIGRGSGAGSLCLYCLGITKLDPIKYGLLFERFINPERVSPPDVDIDFDYVRRDEIFEYIIRKYGTDYCCKIGTYNTFKAKGAIRYAAKALDIGNDWETYQAAKKRNPNAKIEMTKKSLDLADFIAKQIPEVPGTTIESALKDDESFRSAMQKYPKLLDAVRHVENTVSSAGVHPAGIIICKDPIAKHIPLRESKGAICSQFVMSEIDELGLLKLDMLALKTLTVIEDTVQMIKRRYGIDIDIDNLEPTDKNIFKLFNGGYKNMDNRGIFQFEAHGISKLLKNIRVDTFDDLVIGNALYRPGPLGAGVHELYGDYKHGRKKIEYLHPKMGEVLAKNYGIICFQEDVIKVVQVLAGFTLGQADWLRKVIGKKKPELIKKENLDILFIEGCKKHSNIEPKVAKAIFDQIEYFGGYGFNKCLSGDTEVINEIDGRIYRLDELEDLFFRCQGYKEFGIGDLCESPLISIKSLKNGDVINDQVVDVFEVGVRELFEVELDNGFIIKCTMDHKFICSDGEKHELKEIIEKGLEILCES
jgi:DNA polymerase-3 subunit alpha